MMPSHFVQLSCVLLLLQQAAFAVAAEGDVDGSKPLAIDPTFTWPPTIQSHPWWQIPVLARGSTLNATWTPLDRLADRGFATPSKVLLEYGRAKTWTTISELNPDTTKLDWKIPATLDEARDYRLRVVPKDPAPQGQIAWPGVESGVFQVYAAMDLKAAATGVGGSGTEGIEDVSFQGNGAGIVRGNVLWVAVAAAAVGVTVV